MIKLTNIGKTYVSKSKSKVEALKNVSFTLRDVGMTFILGKSGSGKSTLLNLLGGLDRPTTGEIFVDGVSMKDFAQTDYDGYRNDYVGFVFQECNLIDDFNVLDNVAITLQLSHGDDVEQRVINVLEQVGLSRDYLKRRVNELSGGEKQRVAIARALIKESKLILADEPTGNLDSATAESVWSILKNISQTHLVAVVSHDRENAEKYGDRIIEIADGQIVSDSDAVKANQVAQTFKTVKRRLPFRVCLKIGLNSLAIRKVKTLSVILVSIFTILALLIAQIFVTYSPELALARYIQSNNIEYIKIAQGGPNEHDGRYFESSNHYIKYNTREYIAQNAQYVKCEGIISCKQDLIDMGLSFVGQSFELDSDSCYVTMSVVEDICTKYFNSYGFLTYVEVDGEMQPVKGNVDCNFLIGKKIRSSHLHPHGEYKLAGIIDYTGEEIPRVFILDGANNNYLTAKTNIFNAKKFKNAVLNWDNAKFDERFEISSDKFSGTYLKLLTEDGLFDCGDFNDELADNEVIISYDLFSQIFGYGSVSDFFVFPDELIAMPTEIGQRFRFKLLDYDTGNVIVDLGELTLKGVVFETREDGLGNDYRIQISNPYNLKVALAFDYEGYLVKTSSISNLTDFLLTLRGDHLGYVDYAGLVETIDGKQDGIARITYSMQNGISDFAIVFGLIALIMLVVLLLMIVNLISFSVTNRRKEIGILSAVGASNRDIVLIFLIETAIISLLTFCMGLGGSFLIVRLLNIIYSRLFGLAEMQGVFVVDPFVFITLAVVSFVLIMLSALLPTVRIAKSKPIDSIKNI